MTGERYLCRVERARRVAIELDRAVRREHAHLLRMVAHQAPQSRLIGQPRRVVRRAESLVTGFTS
jgi:hypothetical protein